MRMGVGGAYMYDRCVCCGIVLCVVCVYCVYYCSCVVCVVVLFVRYCVLCWVRLGCANL
jgi:hypothetical protein